MKDTGTLRVIAFREGDLWVAQCLEYDIGAQAETLEALETRFALAFAADFKESIERHGKPFAGIDPAPQHFHDLWERRAGEFTPVETAKPTTHDDEIPEYGMALYA